MDNKQVDIEQELDRTKSAVFLGNNAAFLGSILCSMEFEWNSQIQTARTNGLSVQWNPDWFLELTPDERKTVLLHELWHAARLHAVRKGTRDNELWNKACNIRINNDLYREGYVFGEHLEDCFMDASYDIDSEHLASEEAIYDALQQEQEEENQNNNGGSDSNSDDGENPQEEKDSPSNGEDFNNDLEESSEVSPQQQQQLVNTVVNAIQQANMNKSSGTIPGEITEFIDQFLKPVIPWQTLLMRYMTDLMEETWTWQKPNRRFQDIYMPSRIPDEGRLEHLVYFLDVSGSITSEEIIRFFSEVKYIQETLNPKKLTLIQFDTHIRKITELKEDEPFKGFEIIGRGGTSLKEVHDYIVEIKPTAAVIFSDLYCPMMEEIKNIPIIWAIIDNPDYNPPFGKSIHIEI